MSYTTEWIEHPNILQVTYQGVITIDDFLDSWDAINDLHYRYPSTCFSLLIVVLPDRRLPVGILKTASHPAARMFSEVQAAAIVGVDHVMIGMLAEIISQTPRCPLIRKFDSFIEGKRYLQQAQRAEAAGV